MEQYAVECHGLSRRFGNRQAVSNLDLAVPRGSVFGFLGPNGAGKTTTVRMMVGMLAPTSGSVAVLGLDPISHGAEVRSRSGVMLDNVGLYDRLSAAQNLELAARIAGIPMHERGDRIKELLQRVELWDRRNDRISGFSKGMRQKVGLARALMANPDLLILDEPTAGLDPASIVMVRELLVSLAQGSGRTVFLCTHLLGEAQRMCDQVAIIQSGRLVAMGNPNSLGQAEVPTVRLTLSGGDPHSLRNLPLPEGTRLDFLGGREWRATMRQVDDVEILVSRLVEAQIGVRAVVPEQVSLEEEYLRLLGGEDHA
ncbi:ABC transporter ATP-binding protein [Sulfobacillus harzensis]|uniref:ABC transporter ATP-binding protein n=1 Tax=Sulfobacillus harzensis TaxID=2729629 RepID=A0A7Y0L269_9FIRM|nr:ABC transporter ATP-binding protein [Sulfobacillus harzensis]NMP21688.1 ABC transporter ATP-binding protein [Sulfobacillus harzensis]